MARKLKYVSPSVLHKKLMERKSYKESTPRSREDKLTRALARRKRSSE